jgi:N4-(beta-N-acetylglucosaminyl)-L-asparaginase
MKIIASHNGLNAAARAWEALCGRARPLDACVTAATMVEDNPNEHSVGYGGIPNEDGVVELDAAVMDGAAHRGAGVAALRGVRHPTQVAQRLMQQTKRVLLVGEGALQFARANGFPEENLLSEKARRIWLHWKRVRSKMDDWLDPPPGSVDADVQQWFERNYREPDGYGKIGTVHFSALDAHGNVASATSTSGHAFKMPGRVGDSPILGAGLYADNDAGACGSIGHGEANLQHLSSYAVAERMRGGQSPEEAGLDVLRRIAAKTPPEQLDAQGRPRFGLWLFILHKDGRHAGVSMWGPRHYALADADGARLLPCKALFEGAPPLG